MVVLGPEEADLPRTLLSWLMYYRPARAVVLLALVHRSLSFYPTINKSSCTFYHCVRSMSVITELTFDNRNINNLPVERPKDSKTSRPVPNAIFSIVEPTPVKNPKLMSYSTSAFVDLLGLKPPADQAEETTYVEYFGGNKVIPGSRPAAHCYCGHQFGNFAGQLGDGATMYLGEVINPTTGKRWELQVKGAGKTPFSRTADGRKVLRSSVREFLCSEAMHYLGVPTTRAGTCVTSDSTVERDPMYDGGVIEERCTIVSRIAQNFFRFGSFEIFKPRSEDADRAGPSAGNEALKKQLLDHILLYYPTIPASMPEAERYELLFKEVTRRTAYLAAKWQAVGFVHGVLNTDNMSIMGLTIDYGPYGFLEHFDPQYVPNGSDNSARYSYQEQPQICKWNLGKLSEVLSPLLPKGSADRVLAEYDDIFAGYYDALMGAKFGLSTAVVPTEGDREDEPVPVGLGQRLPSADRALVDTFFAALAETHTDFTDAFVALSDFVAALEAHIAAQGSTDADEGAVRDMTATLAFNLLSRSASPTSVVQSMRRKLRIHRLSMHPGQIEQLHMLLQTSSEDQLTSMFQGAPVDAIREEIAGEKRKLDLLVKSSQRVKEYEKMDPTSKRQHDREVWKQWTARYAERIVQLLKEDHQLPEQQEDGARSRSGVMRSQNPTLVLRSWLAQDAIKLAEDGGDYSGVNTLLQMLQEPFNPLYNSFRVADAAGEGGEVAQLTPLQRKYAGTPPEWADSIICTCSS